MWEKKKIKPFEKLYLKAKFDENNRKLHTCLGHMT